MEIGEYFIIFYKQKHFIAHSTQINKLNTALLLCSRLNYVCIVPSNMKQHTSFLLLLGRKLFTHQAEDFKEFIPVNSARSVN